MTAPTPAAAPSRRSAPSVVITVAAAIVLALSASVATTIVGLWLMAAAAGDVLLVLLVVAPSLGIPSLVLAAASFGLIVWGSWQRRRRAVAMAVISLACQLPVLVAVAALGPHVP